MGTLYRKVILNIVDRCFHMYASDYRKEAKEYAIEMLEEIPDHTVQLKADKAELLELMTEMKESFDHKAWVTGMELKSFSSRIESLIQKMKKCQENTPR